MTVTLSLILAIVALVLAVVSIFRYGHPLLAVAVILLAIAYIVP